MGVDKRDHACYSYCVGRATQMSTEKRSHGWKKGASWTCNMCGNPVLHVTIQDKVAACSECVEGSQHCEEWTCDLSLSSGDGFQSRPTMTMPPSTKYSTC